MARIRDEIGWYTRAHPHTEAATTRAWDSFALLLFSPLLRSDDALGQRCRCRRECLSRPCCRRCPSKKRVDSERASGATGGEATGGEATGDDQRGLSAAVWGFSCALNRPAALPWSSREIESREGEVRSFRPSPLSFLPSRRGRDMGPSQGRALEIPEGLACPCDRPGQFPNRLPLPIPIGRKSLGPA